MKSNVGRRCGTNGILILANRVNVLENNLALSSQRAYTLNSTIPPLGIYPRETRVVHVQQETRIATFSIVAKTKQKTQAKNPYPKLEKNFNENQER